MILFAVRKLSIHISYFSIVVSMKMEFAFDSKRLTQKRATLVVLHIPLKIQSTKDFLLCFGPVIFLSKQSSYTLMARHFKRWVSKLTCLNDQAMHCLARHFKMWVSKHICYVSSIPIKMGGSILCFDNHETFPLNSHSYVIVGYLYGIGINRLDFKNFSLSAMFAT